MGGGEAWSGSGQGWAEGSTPWRVWPVLPPDQVPTRHEACCSALMQAG
jgi:hypothetical protein